MKLLDEIVLKKKKSFEEIKEKGIFHVENFYLGKTGLINNFFLRVAREDDKSSKKDLGKEINDWKKELIEKLSILKKKEEEIIREKEDEDFLTFLEGKKIKLGSIHPITNTIRKIYEIFSSLGYKVAESTEIDNEENNFDKLNIPSDHPARTMHDTFYLDNGEFLLRTHTSNTQIRVMKENPNKELKIISSGRVYRRDEDDSTHTHQFTQLEVFFVGKNVSFASLKGTIEFFLENVFGKKNPIRFRPSYFPFTEPSVEVDARCIICLGKGCKTCKNTGWVEILGAGLIHDKVLRNCGFDSEKFSGFAFGLGVERLLMIQYGIEDIRNLYLNDSRFLRQFKKFSA